MAVSDSASARDEKMKMLANSCQGIMHETLGLA